MNVNQEDSQNLVCQIDSGDLTLKPGWIRMSIHPTTTNQEIQFVCNSIKTLAANHQSFIADYVYDKNSNEFIHINAKPLEKVMVEAWFKV